MSRQTGSARDAGSTTSLEMTWAHGGPRGERQPGLILLYTPSYSQLPAAMSSEATTS